VKVVHTIKYLLITVMINGCNSYSRDTQKEHLAFIGTYTNKEGHVNGQADGIYSVYQEKDGNLRMGKIVAEIKNPSFVKSSKDGRNLYAVSELGGKDAESGFIYSYKINPDHSLEEIGKISTESFAPCHIEIDQNGEYVFVSNYTGGVVMIYKRKANGEGNLEKQQKITFENPEESHPHSVSISADNQHAYIADLGNDKIWIFDFDAEKGQLAANDQEFVALEKGAGPRHFSFSKDDNFVYSINELNSSVSTFKVLEDGGLEVVQNISSLPENSSGKNFPADIHVHPSGKFLYVSNRGHNSITSFIIEDSTGKLTYSGNFSTLGDTPRNFAIAPGGRFLYVANQDSNIITFYNIDLTSGILIQHLEPLKLPTPVCIEFVEKMDKGLY